MRQNVVWLLIDSLSSLHVEPSTMPFLSGLLDQCLHFTDHVTTTPYTSAAWYTMITGRYAQRCGYDAFSLGRCNDRFFQAGHHQQDNIIARAKAAGYHTVLHSPYAHSLDWLPGWSESVSLTPDALRRRSEGLRPVASPLLWVLHYAGLHHDTVGAKRDVALTQEYYPLVLRKHDKAIQRLVENCVQPSDILVIASDHGVTWVPTVDEHHGGSLYESSIRTLFALRIGTRGPVRGMTRSIDVAPTLASLLDLPALPDIDGESLWPQIGRLWHLEAILETGPSWQTPDYHSRFGIRGDRFKYIFNWTSETLHDLRFIASPDSKHIAREARQIEDQEVLEQYREKLLTYMHKYNLRKQIAQLGRVAKRGAKCGT